MADIQISQNHEVDLANYISTGDFEKAVEILSKNPEAFTFFIRRTGEGIIQSKTKAQEVKDRNWIKQLFSSPSTDLAKVVLDQNETMANFFVLLQLLTLSAKGNVQLLSELCQSIKRVGNVGDIEQKNINEMAIDFLEHNIESIKQAEIRDKALKKLLKAAEITDQFELRIASLVDEIEQNTESFKEEVNKEYLKFIGDIGNKLESIHKEVKDSDNKIILQFSEELNRLSEKLGNTLNEQISTISSKLEDNERNSTLLMAKMNKKFIVSTSIAIVALLSTFLSFVLLL